MFSYEFESLYKLKNQLDIVNAVYAGNLELIESALVSERGSVIRASIHPADRDRDGNALIHHAARAGQNRILQFLLELPGIQIDRRNFDGCSPVFLAAEAQKENAFKILLLYGANPRLRDNQGRIVEFSSAIFQYIKGMLDKKEKWGLSQFRGHSLKNIVL